MSSSGVVVFNKIEPVRLEKFARRTSAFDFRDDEENQGISFFQGALQSRLEGVVTQGTPLGLFLINIKAYSLFEKLYGQKPADQVIGKLKDILAEVAQQAINGSKFMFIERVERASLVVLFELGRTSLDVLMDQALEIRVVAQHHFDKEVVGFTGQKLALEVGCARVATKDKETLFQNLFDALCDARQVADGILDAKRLSMMAEFQELLRQPKLFMVYQPLVDLRSHETMGWEALARGPREGHFESPKAMFDFAEEVGNLFELERTCREQALAGLGELEPGQKLFLNVHPRTLGDPHFRKGVTQGLLDGYGLKPSNLVFEITERHSIEDFVLFHRTLDHYRSQGFLVAIDDVGTGFSGLNRIARLRPEYIKADMALVQGVDRNPVQRAILETLVSFADKIGCAVIAEGIETASELSTLVSMGLHYGQGFFLASPARPKPKPQVNIPVRADTSRGGAMIWKCALPIKSLVEPAPQVAPDARVREVKTLLDTHPISGVVVVADQRPLGLVMSHSLNRQLGTQYGSALYLDKGVGLVMDTSPLVVDSLAPVESVANKAMSREHFKLYDHIVVTDDGNYLGVVSVQKMLVALARVQVEMAKGANPLTGLPGNLTIEAEIERHCGNDECCSIVYVDLDNFKIFNDTYGFEAGDRMLRLISDILAWACRRHGDEATFLGHIGGDDFVIIAPPDKAERICKATVRCFSRLVPGLYTPEDASKGYVEAKGRDGQPGRFPLVSVSMGIVDVAGGGCDLSLIGQRSAEVKHYAKSKPGNIFVRDRRQPLGSS